MKSILIRDLDASTYSAIKQLAKMHHRSMQGELHAILEQAAKLVPDRVENGEIKLYTVSTGSDSAWSREEMYGTEGR